MIVAYTVNILSLHQSWLIRKPKPVSLRSSLNHPLMPLSFGFSPLRFPLLFDLSTPTDHHTKIKSNSSPSPSWLVATPAATKSARKPTNHQVLPVAASEPTRRQWRWRVATRTATVPPLSRVSHYYSYASERLQTRFL
jgi:hypothetical protein